MPSMEGGMELWAIVPELLLAGVILVLLPLGAFVPLHRRAWTTWIALAALGAALVASAVMLAWPPRPVFGDTYVVDPFAVYFKLFAIVATAAVLLATQSHFAGQPHEAAVPSLMLLACLGVIGLAASQDLALIALFVQLVTVSSYILVGVAKHDRRATEGALKLFLFSAAAGAVMIYGMSLLYGLTGTLRLPEVVAQLPAAPVVTALAALGFVLVGYGFKITLVPFHGWAPDTYQGAPTPIAGFLAAAPKAAGVAILMRTLVVALPDRFGHWPAVLAVMAAATMTLGNLFALRQTSAKRLLAYSSIAQAGYLLVGVAAASLDRLAMPGLLMYLAVYLCMNLGAFLAVDAIERRLGSDDIASFDGLGAQLPWSAAVLALSLLSLAGIPPLGGFVGKTMLFGAALGAGWTWLAIVMAANVAVSLFYYVRVLEPLYLRSPVRGASALVAEPMALRAALVALGIGTIVSGVFPASWTALATYASAVLGR